MTSMESGTAGARQETLDLLRRAVPFAALTDEWLKKVAAIAQREQHARGDVVYEVGDQADDFFIIASGRVEHALGPGAQATTLVKELDETSVFGWAAILKDQTTRLAKVTCKTDCELLRFNGEALLDTLRDDPDAAEEVLGRFARVVIEDFTLPSWMARVMDVPGETVETGQATAGLTGLSLTMYRISKWLQSPKPYLMLIGFALFFGGWWLASEVFKVWRFDNLPGPLETFQEWASPDPIYGLSLYTPEYYMHIWVSVRRILEAFAIATGLGVPVGLFLGWSRRFREYVFPVFETLRPIPILAWVPLAIIMFTGVESSVVFLTTLASFYATALNTMLGVESIDESYPRAAQCLGASHWQTFRHIVVPGALPYIFTGLQISVGVAWFSLVAAEMVSGEFGLGYVINTSYTMVRYPTIVIGMVTLGVVGYVTSALVRIAGDHMMQWRVRELALGEGQ